ncbi:hypothetical protein LOAG_00176 [Loa loa]|uniref:Uncharacterized protein n=1 Tax=Loa loa TaxID=7209 RepID=A0A1S0UC21_LOALO|nr:hypothetical protein LOAG_00176 [Loa loa]EFO28319.1 hypothetical protein LOAG_00176 [Loa loa]
MTSKLKKMSLKTKKPSKKMKKSVVDDFKVCDKISSGIASCTTSGNSSFGFLTTRWASAAVIISKVRIWRSNICLGSSPSQGTFCVFFSDQWFLFGGSMTIGDPRGQRRSTKQYKADDETIGPVPQVVAEIVIEKWRFREFEMKNSGQSKESMNGSVMTKRWKAREFETENHTANEVNSSCGTLSLCSLNAFAVMFRLTRICIIEVQVACPHYSIFQTNHRGQLFALHISWNS